MSMETGKKVRTAILVASALAMTLSAAWAGGTREKKEPGATVGSASDPLVKKIEISWIGPGGAEVEENNYVQQRIEKKFNVKITNKKVNIFETEQINLMLNTGEMPDCGFMYPDPLDVHLKGITRTVPKALIVKYAPNFARTLDENPLGWKTKVKPGSTDEYLSLTGIALNQRAHLMHAVYRYDWLLKAGLEPRDVKIEALDGAGRLYYTQSALELEKLEKIFEAFTKGDPDGNGKNDTFAMSACSDIMYSWGTLMGAFGYGYQFNVDDNGKLAEWCIAPQHREFLKTAARWYRNRWLDPEFVTLSREKMWEKITNGSVGYHNNPLNYLDLTSEGFKKRPPLSILEKNKDAKLLVTTGETGKDGKRGVRQWSATGIFNYNFFFNRKVDDEKLIRILQIFDYINFDKDGIVWSHWGEPGVHFDWSGAANASPPILRKGTTAKMGFGFYDHSINGEEYLPFMYSGVPLKLFQWANSEGLRYVIRPYKMDVFNTTKYAEVNAKYGSGLDTIWKEFFYKAITGEVDVDAEWNAYVAKWKKAGGDKILEELEKAAIVKDLDS